MYWLASNVSSDAPLVLAVDDLQWCDAPSARALAFIARRLEALPLALILASRPVDPGLCPEAAALLADPATEILRPASLTRAAVSALIAGRLSRTPDARFVEACLEITAGNPFLLAQLLEEAAARGLAPSASDARDVGAIVPRGVANAVLLRLARLPGPAAVLARALSVLADGAQVGDAAQLAGIAGQDLEAAMSQLIATGVVDPGGTIRFTHPIVLRAIYDDISPAERERLHHAAWCTLRERRAPLRQIAAHVGGMLFFAGRTAEGAAVLRRAQERLPASGAAHEDLEVALLAASYTSVSARREADPTIATLRDPGGPARSVLQATTLATLAMDEVTYVRSAARAIDLARRALVAGLPAEPHRGESWVLLALAALVASDALGEARRGIDELLARARARGSALAVVTVSSLRAATEVRAGDLVAAQADAQAAIELAPDLLGAEFAGLAVAAAVLAGLDRDETPESLRGLIDASGVHVDTEFMPNAPLRYASGVLRAAAGNHEDAIEELRGCAVDQPAYGGENPAMFPWRCARGRSSGPRRRGRRGWPRRSRCSRIRRRGSSTLECWSTSARPCARQDSEARRGGRCSTASRGQRGAGPGRLSAAPAASSPRSAFAPAVSTAPGRIR